MVTIRQKMLGKLKCLINSSTKGGVTMMNEFQDEMMDVIKDVRSAKLPNKTAEVIHKTGHRIVMDKHAECRMFDRGIRDEQLQASLKAMRDV